MGRRCVLEAEQALMLFAAAILLCLALGCLIAIGRIAWR